MTCRRRVLRIGSLCALLAAGAGCATQVVQPTLTFEQHSLRIPLAVGADGTVSLAERPPLIGRLDLSEILQAEGIRPGAPRTTVQLMLHYGRIYVVGDSFRSVWEITPQPGTCKASYRPIPVLEGTGQARLKNVRLSRYGSSGSSCLRLDRVGDGPVFITSQGDVRNDCP
ncbi:MAG TPA: hypothetical protein VFB95_09540 [Candidatus Cryosericum sp.]|nr:hypothetical protein [Candidatus Cryosericum sp.]